MKKSQVVLSLLLPADQQAARAIEPRMGAFDDPSTSTSTRMQDFVLFFLSTATQMWHVAMFLDDLQADRIVIASIQAQMLRLFFIRRWSGNDDAFQGGAKQLHVMAVGSINDESQRNPRSISQQAPFDSPLAAICGIFAGRGVSERGGWLIAPSTLCHSHWMPCTSS